MRGRTVNISPTEVWKRPFEEFVPYTMATMIPVTKIQVPGWTGSTASRWRRLRGTVGGQQVAVDAGPVDLDIRGGEESSDGLGQLVIAMMMTTRT